MKNAIKIANRITNSLGDFLNRLLNRIDKSLSTAGYILVVLLLPFVFSACTIINENSSVSSEVEIVEPNVIVPIEVNADSLPEADRIVSIQDINGDFYNVLLAASQFFSANVSLSDLETDIVTFNFLATVTSTVIFDVNNVQFTVSNVTVEHSVNRYHVTLVIDSVTNTVGADVDISDGILLTTETVIVPVATLTNVIVVDNPDLMTLTMTTAVQSEVSATVIMLVFTNTVTNNIDEIAMETSTTIDYINTVVIATATVTSTMFISSIITLDDDSFTVTTSDFVLPVDKILATVSVTLASTVSNISMTVVNVTGVVYKDSNNEIIVNAIDVINMVYINENNELHVLTEEMLSQIALMGVTLPTLLLTLGEDLTISLPVEVTSYIITVAQTNFFTQTNTITSTITVEMTDITVTTTTTTEITEIVNTVAMETVTSVVSTITTTQTVLAILTNSVTKMTAVTEDVELTLYGTYLTLDTSYTTITVESITQNFGITAGLDENGDLSYAILPYSSTKSSINYETDEYDTQWGLATIGGAAAYSRGYFGQGVTVAVVDSGVLTTHNELKNNLLPGVEFDNNGFVDNSVIDPTDSDGHGTHVAGIIGAQLDGTGFHGVAPSVKILPIQASQEGDNILFGAHTGLIYAITNTTTPVQIINNSWGSSYAAEGTLDGGEKITVVSGLPIFKSFIDDDSFVGLTSSFEDYANALDNNGTNLDKIIVFSAGNNYWNDFSGNIYYTQNDNTLTITNNEFLAQYEDDEYGLASTWGVNFHSAGGYALAPFYETSLLGNYVVVVATDLNNNIATFSNSCGESMQWCIAAPGVDITSAHNANDNETSVKSGTSQAAPHVSGALALLRSRLQNVPMNIVLEILFATADDLGPVGIDAVYGNGLLNIQAAITVQGSIVLKITPVNEYDRQLGLGLVGAQQAYDDGYFGQGVTIAVVANGFRTSHNEFIDRLDIGSRLDINGVFQDSDLSLGDGTQVAAVIAASKDDFGIHGVAPSSTIQPIQVPAPDINNNDYSGNLQGVLYAMTLANHAPIIQGGYLGGLQDHLAGFPSHLGLPGVKQWGNVQITSDFYYYPAFEGLLNYNHKAAQSIESADAYIQQFTDLSDNIFTDSVKKDLVLVYPLGEEGWQPGAEYVVGGNSPMTVSIDSIIAFYKCGLFCRDSVDDSDFDLNVHNVTDTSEIGVALAPIYESALEGNFVVVGAVDSDNELAIFSNVCGAKAIDWCMVAPGVDIYSAANDSDIAYASTSSNDQAAAHVSGALALLRSRFTEVPMSVLLEIIFETADDIGDTGDDAIFGQGLLNISTAIKSTNAVALKLQEEGIADKELLASFETAEYLNQSALNKLGASRAYADGYFGQGVTVALVGSGFLTTHIDLTSNLLVGAQVDADGFVDGDLTVTDGAASHVAGIIAAAKNDSGIHGVAPSVSLLPIQVSLSSQTDNNYETSLQGVLYAMTLANHAPIIQGGYLGGLQDHLANFAAYDGFAGAVEQWGNVQITSNFAYYPAFEGLLNYNHKTDQSIESAAAYIQQFTDLSDNIQSNGVKKDLVLVYPLGEEGWQPGTEYVVEINSPATLSIDDLIDNYKCGLFCRNSEDSSDFDLALHNISVTTAIGVALAPIYKSALEGNFVVVGAVDSDNELAIFSNVCGTEAIDWCMVAPGVDINSLGNSSDSATTTISGNDQAAAHVSGALALLRSRFTEVPMSVLLEIIFETADDIGAAGDDAIFGQGLLNAASAIQTTDSAALQLQEEGIAAKELLASFETAEYLNQSALDKLGASRAYADGYFGQGVTVALVGSGFLTTHIDLTSNLLVGAQVDADGFVDNNLTVTDGAASHVAGIIAAAKNDSGIHGVAPSVSLLPIQVSLSSQTDNNYETSLQGVLYAMTLANYAPIIQGGFLGGVQDHEANKGNYDGDEANIEEVVIKQWGNVQITSNLNYTPAFQGVLDIDHFHPAADASAAAYKQQFTDLSDNIQSNGGKKDVVLVYPLGEEGWQPGTQYVIEKNDSPIITVSSEDLAEGDEGIDGDNAGYHCGNLCIAAGVVPLAVAFRSNLLAISVTSAAGVALAPIYESALEGNFVVVGAVDSDNTLATFSNVCGAEAIDWCMVAPGVDINSLDNSSDSATTTISGNDQAAAHVSGALALLRSRFTEVPMSVLLEIIFETADDIGAAGDDAIFGQGLLNAASAIQTTDSAALQLQEEGIAAKAFETAEYLNQSALDKLGASRAYADGYFGQGVTVALVGSGFLTTHIDLTSNLLVGAQVDANGFVDNNLTVTDGAASHVAGIIAATKNDSGIHGVAPSVSLLPIQVSLSDQSDNNYETSLQGVLYAMTLANHAPIIQGGFLGGVQDHLAGFGVYNGFVGAVEPWGNVQITSNFYYYPAFEGLLNHNHNADQSNESVHAYIQQFTDLSANIFTDSVKKDLVLVYPLGEEGWQPGAEYFINFKENFATDTTLSIDSLLANYRCGLFCRDDQDSSFAIYLHNVSVTSPIGVALAPIFESALEGNFVVVGAVDSDNNLAEFSNVCGTEAIDWCMVAPGVDINSLDNSSDSATTTISGNDQAAAHVSGALALLRSRFTEVPMSVLLEIIFETADDIGAAGDDAIFGQGLLNIATAIQSTNSVALALQPDSVIVQNNVINDSELNDGDALLVKSYSKLSPIFYGLTKALDSNYVAVEYLPGRYYNMPLSDLLDIDDSIETQLPSTGGLAKAMIDGGDLQTIPLLPNFSIEQNQNTGQMLNFNYSNDVLRIRYEVCGGSDSCNDRSSLLEGSNLDNLDTSLPYFVQDKQRVYSALSLSESWEIFSGIGLGEEAEESSYRQYGVRWGSLDNTLLGQLFADYSQIHEEGSVLGGQMNGGLGATGSKTHLLRVGSLYSLTPNWDIFGQYNWGTGSASSIPNNSMIKSLDYKIDAIKFGLVGESVFRSNDTMRLGFSKAGGIRDGKMTISRGVNVNNSLEYRTETLNWSDEAVYSYYLGYGMNLNKYAELGFGLEYVDTAAVGSEESASFFLRWRF